jgi:uncharacterized protein
MMYDAHISKIALELKLAPQRVAATVSLLDDAATVPFIARYRKEMTGSLDEVLITTIRDRSWHRWRSGGCSPTNCAKS